MKLAKIFSVMIPTLETLREPPKSDHQSFASSKEILLGYTVFAGHSQESCLAETRAKNNKHGSIKPEMDVLFFKIHLYKYNISTMVS